MTNPVQPAQPGAEFEAHTPAFTPQEQPVAGVPAPVGPQPKKTGVVVLAVLAVLLLGAAGTFGALYFAEKSRASDLSKQLEDKDKRLTAQTMLGQQNLEQARKADESAKKASDELAAAQKCREAAKSLTAAALANDNAKGEAALKDMMLNC